MDDIYMLSDGIIMNRIGTRLKAIRLKQNITQQNLAKEAGISISSVK
ncbi:MAG: helix-turn-helix transcriptional regulator, partial [Bacteroidales bacterium]|nr:helix-turn-helix transcriptional regulator [Bacteroidales bacterium]